MEDFSIEGLREKAESAYKLVIVASMRALELNATSFDQVKMGGRKPSTVALEEIFKGKVWYEEKGAEAPKKKK